jgi:hypothetical protein
VAIGPAADLGPKGKAGIEAVKNRNYVRAQSLLEDALAETPGNPVLYEYQGIAYLGCGGSINSTECRKKAEAAMVNAIEAGGRATVIVDRSLEAGGVFSKANMLDVQRGWLHISKSGLEFEPERPDAKHPGFNVPPDDVKSAAMNSVNGVTTNSFHIDVRGKNGNHNFRTSNFSTDEAQIIFRVMAKYFGPGVTIKQK